MNRVTLTIDDGTVIYFNFFGNSPTITVTNQGIEKVIKLNFANAGLIRGMLETIRKFIDMN